MGALTIAFDITIVGALALPWVLIVIHLFFFEGENRLEGVLRWVKKKGQQAVAGVLLFAMTYTLGSAVSRTAKDFFNDDDLYIQLREHRYRERKFQERIFRVGVTEDRIVTRVYCEINDHHLLSAETDNPAIEKTVATFKGQTSPEGCERTLRWTESHTYVPADDDLIGTARDLFSLQENSLLLKGEDATLRLRQLHDQIMVLRGAAFNGVIGFSLCLFAWSAACWREKPRSWLSQALVRTPAVYLLVALIATVHHFAERAPSDPPYMEFTLFLLALAGLWLVLKPPATPPPDQVRAKETDAGKETPTETGKDTGKEKAKNFYWQEERWARLVVLSAVLTTAAVLGWWSTELLYAEQVIYSYDSQISQSKGTTAPKK